MSPHPHYVASALTLTLFEPPPQDVTAPTLRGISSMFHLDKLRLHLGRVLAIITNKPVMVSGSATAIALAQMVVSDTQLVQELSSIMKTQQQRGHLDIETKQYASQSLVQLASFLTVRQLMQREGTGTVSGAVLTIAGLCQQGVHLMTEADCSKEDWAKRCTLSNCVRLLAEITKSSHFAEPGFVGKLIESTGHYLVDLITAGDILTVPHAILTLTHLRDTATEEEYVAYAALLEGALKALGKQLKKSSSKRSSVARTTNFRVRNIAPLLHNGANKS